MQLPNFSPKTSRLGKYYYLISAICFVLSGLAGFLASIHVGIDSSHTQWIAHLRMQVLRPLHTMLSLVAMLSGGMAITSSLLQSIAPPIRKGFEGITLMLLVTFICLATITLLMGITSGREYVSWVPLLSLILIPAVLLTTCTVIQRFRELSTASPEGYWLLVLGWLLTAFGLIETHEFLVPYIFSNGVRDLSSQWHGIDTIIAGVNVMLYAGMIFVLQQKPKPLRKRWLYFFAGFGLLGTFGHHHYASPQPGYLKVFAFAASMVAILSFFRHLNGYLKEWKQEKQEPHPIMPLVLAAEYWTIVAVGSGILFAIPQINFYVHGTYLIVIHAMGSMIGINFMIIIAAALLFMGYEPNHSRTAIKWGVRMTNWALSLLWVGLAVPSLIKGILRTHQSYQQFFPLTEPWLILFPICGLLLFAGIFVLTSELVWLVFNPRPQTNQDF
jgi:nitric oxide reductase large subunit